MKQKFSKLIIFLLILFICPDTGITSVNADDSTDNTTPDKHEITQIANYAIITKGFTLNAGDTEELISKENSLEVLFQFIGGCTEDELYETALYASDIDYNVDINTPGKYFITVTLEVIPEESNDFYIADDLKTIKIPVFVNAANTLELNEVLHANSQYYFSYNLKAFPGTAEIYFCTVDKNTEITESNINTLDWKLCEDSLAVWALGTITISSDAFDENYDYYFYIKINDTISNIINPQTGVGLKSDNMNGDRDGGDNKGNVPADSAPTTTIKPISSSDDNRQTSDSTFLGKAAETLNNDSIRNSAKTYKASIDDNEPNYVFADNTSDAASDNKSADNSTAAAKTTGNTTISKTPKTGDNSNNLLIFGTLSVSILLFAAANIQKRRNNA